MDDFLWLRPLWLWALLPWCLAAVWLWRRTGQSSAWLREVDPALREHVIESGETGRRRGPLALMAAWLLCLLILAGPVWQQQDTPLFEARASEVVLFDLSNSMLADDLSPNRLTRARYVLRDLLDAGGGVEQALIGFAERPYVISPLTDDSDTIEAFLPSLSPDIMPVQGSRMDLALTAGLELLQRSGVAHAHLVLITDGDAGEPELLAAERIAAAGHRLSVVAVGTRAGGALMGSDGRPFVDELGVALRVAVDLPALEALAGQGGGVIIDLASERLAAESLSAVRQQLALADDAEAPSSTRHYWVEWGPWVLWPLTAGATLLFRRGIS